MQQRQGRQLTELISFQDEKTTTSSPKGTVVNRAYNSINKGSLEMLTLVPLTWVNLGFNQPWVLNNKKV